jgi:hypothetical protein
MANKLIEAIENAIAAGKITEQPSLKAMAMTLEVKPVRIYQVAKTPVEGQVFDPRVYNMDAVEGFIGRRLSADKGYGTFDEFIDKAIQVDETIKANDGRRSTGSSEGKFIQVGEVLVPVRRREYNIGDKILIKGEESAEPYEIVYMSDTHLVLKQESAPTLRLMSNWLVNIKIIPPDRYDETLAKRQAAAAEVQAEPNGACQDATPAE